MYAKTHVIAGAVAGYCMYPSWAGILAGSIGGLISDIDETKSYLGRLVLPISVILKYTIKHRTLSHSLLFASGLTIVLAPILFLFFHTWLISLAFFAGVISHILGDMITGRVQLFWPYQKKYGIRMPFLVYRFVDIVFRSALIVLIVYKLISGDVIAHLLANTKDLLG
ncbi:inner membrane protein [Paenibacillus sp. PastF-3]|uniref:metal-dependent hydrolase n=1 Tax=Paenibacillus sp. PastF-3 TaxID=2940626 RepID=UPI002476E618|nr:metal-dependent hydrolase [Paenibacillus sp. PastF-3]MDH6372907.1 inner membrane protein [Paenibacillus sp. PastF-3]